MIGSQNKDIVFKLYQDSRTVFDVSDVALLCGEHNRASLSKKLNYYVGAGKILNPRKGIYAKADYRKEELAVKLFTPSYLSLHFVLLQAGVIFQYSESVTAISYLSRTLQVDNQDYVYRKVKPDLLYNWHGISQDQAGVYKASPERAFLDLLYLEPDFYFDYLDSLDRSRVNGLLRVYTSAALNRRVKRMLSL